MARTISLWMLSGAMLICMMASPAGCVGAELSTKTLESFERYVKFTEARIEKELSHSDRFLYVENLPEQERKRVVATLQAGEVYMERLETRDAGGKRIECPGGMIHHWLGAVFIPNANLRSTLDFVQDYDHHQDYYQPEVIRSRLVERDGNVFKIFYRLREKKIITVTMNTEHDVVYYPVDETRMHSRSYSTKIAEVADADTPAETEKPIGHDSGFLWRLYSYWRFQEKDGGVYVECESISLTRGLPFLIGYIIKGFVTEIPRESLLMTMGSTRSGVTRTMNSSKQHLPQ